MGGREKKLCVIGTLTIKLKHSKRKVCLEYFWEPEAFLLLLTNRTGQNRYMYRSAVLR